MLGIYFLDYSFLAYHGKKIAVAVLMLIGYGILTGNIIKVGGNYPILQSDIFPMNLSLNSILFFYVPIYGAVIYQYFGERFSGILKSIAWMIVPVFFLILMKSYYMAVLICISLSFVMFVAIWKGWFKVNKMIFGTVLIILNMIFPFVMPFELDHEYYVFRKHMLNLFIYGQGFGGRIKEGRQFSVSPSNTLGYIVGNHGSILTIILLSVIVIAIIKMFHISWRQKNQLGSVIGCGCSMVFLTNLILNIMENFGFAEIGNSYLPFFSYGGSFLIVNYLFMGMILSIYRHKNVYPIRFEKKVKMVEG